MIVVTRVAEGQSVLGDVEPGQRRRELVVPEVPSEEWVASRVEILDRVTAAALRLVQVPFTWVWRTAPERFDQVAEIAERIYPSAVVLGSEQTSDAVAPDADSFLTVRLDSDDALLPQAMDAAAAMQLPPRALVNWIRGWQLGWPSGEVAPWHWPRRRQGPFLAVTHEDRDLMLDAGIPHGTARQGRTVVEVEDRSWLQTIHGRNQMNRWRKQEPLGPEDADEVLGAAGIRL